MWAGVFFENFCNKSYITSSSLLFTTSHMLFQAFSLIDSLTLIFKSIKAKNWHCCQLYWQGCVVVNEIVVLVEYALAYQKHLNVNLNVCWLAFPQPWKRCVQLQDQVHLEGSLRCRPIHHHALNHHQFLGSELPLQEGDPLPEICHCHWIIQGFK